MRAFTAAAVQVAPVPGPLTATSVAANVAKLVEFTRRCVEATGAELVVLPESATTGFTPGCPTEELWELVSELPGPVIEPLRDVAAELGVHLVAGTYERGPTPEIVYNSSVLIDPRGRAARRLPQDAPVLLRGRLRRGLGHAGRHGDGV